MPYQDRTGPFGQGPRSGRGMGQCGGGNYAERPYGFGRGRRGAWRGQRGSWRGRGWSRFETAPEDNFPAERGLSWIQEQLDQLQAAIQKLTARLDAKE